jgi:DNA-binding NtrC family response regulator
MLSPRIRAPEAARPAAPPPSAQSLPEAIDALERAMIRAALDRHGGNKTRAAAELGISRRNLIRLVQKYGMATSDED